MSDLLIEKALIEKTGKRRCGGAAKRAGLKARKSRWRRNSSIDNYGGFQIVDPYRNWVVGRCTVRHDGRRRDQILHEMTSPVFRYGRDAWKGMCCVPYYPRGSDPLPDLPPRSCNMDRGGFFELAAE